MRHLAAWTAGNHQRCRPPARKTRCKRSGCPCCRGLPGAIKRGAIGCARSHCVTGCARHAGPLSRLPYPGAPDGTRRRCSPWPPSPAVIARAPTRARRSRGDAARTVRHGRRRPSVGSACPTSSRHPGWGAGARGGVGVLTPAGRFWRPRGTTWRPSCCRLRRTGARLPRPCAPSRRTASASPTGDTAQTGHP